LALAFGADEAPFAAGLARALAEDAEQVLDVAAVFPNIGLR